VLPFLVYSTMACAAAWLIGLICLGLDALTSILGIRAAQDRALTPRAERRWITANVWSLFGGAVLAMLIGFGVDVAVRMLFDWDMWLAGAGLVLLLVYTALFGIVGIMALILRDEAESYVVLRAALAERTDHAFTVDQIAEFREQLGRLDEKHRRIRLGPRDRAGLPAVRARLDTISGDLALVPAVGLGALARLDRPTVHAYLWRGSAARLLPAAFALAVFLAAILATVAGAPGFGIVVGALALVATVGSFLFALFTVRLVLAAKLAQHAVHRVQRADVARLLEERERTARKRTAGLGDRVSRALQILRDQQR
jgi:ABC-type multidrug transport system fused ATPase/permease subunit